MATTAKQSASDVRGAANFQESEEDIATIAKQISDHAEAIYQTWKARGLGPTEILNCHADADNTFNQTLSPKSPTANISPELLAKAPDLSNQNLKHLVSSFVNEDKARIAAQKGDPAAGPPASPSSVSSIKYALQKFEKKSQNQESSPIAAFLNSPSVYTSNNTSSQKSPTPSKNKNNNNSSYQNNNRPDVTELEKPRQKPETPVKPDHLLNHVPTWPLKNRLGSTKNDMKGTPDKHLSNGNGSRHSSVLENNTPTSFDVMDEVSREEEKLINALKTGTVLNDSQPEVIDSTDYISDNGVAVSGEPLNYIVPIQKGPTPPPQKPNHTPIFVLHKEDQSKRDTNFTRVPTTRLPSRLNQDAVFPPPKDKKEFAILTVPSPIRPFLSRGSVAERVLIFEKCPEKAPARTVVTVKEPVKAQVKLNKILPPLHSTLQRHFKKSANFTIPQFFFPNGKPPPTITTETTIQRLELVFNQFENYEIPRDKFHIVVTICQVPLYWRVPLFMCTPLTKTGCVNGNVFLNFWRQMTSFCHDAASRFVYIVCRGNRQRQYILPEDMAPLIQDVVDTHPGLAFLREAAEFHSRYVHTVIARIYYCVNRSWSGRMTVTELRKSNLMEVIQLLEEEEDINQIMAFFSYEHFYVIYCKFWELDRDHDLYIDQLDLARHNDHALSSRMIERIFSGCVTRGRNRTMQIGPNGPRMSYTDFVWFLLAEEDKTHATAIEYWFRCMDIDGDGILSMYELEYFYEEQQHRMEQLGIETLPFEDCLCQMLDMIKPMKSDCITLSDLKRCKMTPIFFDTFFNLEKYMEHEQRDPFAQKENEELTDWDRFAAQEYELLVAEEGGEGAGNDEEPITFIKRRRPRTYYQRRRERIRKQAEKDAMEELESDEELDGSEDEDSQ